VRPECAARPERGTPRTLRAACDRARRRASFTTRSCARASASVRKPCGSNTGAHLGEALSFQRVTVTSAARAPLCVATMPSTTAISSECRWRDVDAILVLGPIAGPGSTLRNQPALTRPLTRIAIAEIAPALSGRQEPGRKAALYTRPQRRTGRLAQTKHGLNQSLTDDGHLRAPKRGVARFASRGRFGASTHRILDLSLRMPRDLARYRTGMPRPRRGT